MAQEQEHKESDASEQEEARVRRANQAMYESFITPRTLEALFLEPQRVARNWVEAIVCHQDSMIVGSAERQMFHMGGRFRAMLGYILTPHQEGGADAWWPFALVAIVTFLFHTAPSRVRLRNQDVAFLNGEATPHINTRVLLDHWLLGRMPFSGGLLTRPEDALVNHSIALAYHLAQVYRTHWLFDPLEEAALPHAVRSKAVY